MEKPLGHAISTRMTSFNQKMWYHNLIEGNKKETATQRSRLSSGSKSFLGRVAGNNTSTFKPSKKCIIVPSTKAPHRGMGEFIHFPESLIYYWKDDL